MTGFFLRWARWSIAPMILLSSVAHAQAPTEGEPEAPEPAPSADSPEAAQPAGASASFPPVPSEESSPPEAPAAEQPERPLEAPAAEQPEKEPETPAAPGSEDPVDAPLQVVDHRRTSATGHDGERFRFGLQSGFGGVFEKNNDYLFHGTDLRAGLQFGDSLGLYFVPRLGVYAGGSSESGIGGLLGIGTGMDWTFADRFFVGAGVGAAILNNPKMLDVSVRVGGYPKMWRSDERIRRHGFVVALDVHHYRGSLYRVYSPVLSLGYEAF